VNNALTKELKHDSLPKMLCDPWLSNDWVQSGTERKDAYKSLTTDAELWVGLKRARLQMGL